MVVLRRVQRLASVVPRKEHQHPEGVDRSTLNGSLQGGQGRNVLFADFRLYRLSNNDSFWRRYLGCMLTVARCLLLYHTFRPLSDIPDRYNSRIGDGMRQDDFQNWIGSSKAVDEDGYALKLYHGARSPRPIKVMKGSSIWFAESPGLASIYSMNAYDAYDRQSAIYPAHIRAENPLDLNALGATTDDYMAAMEFSELVGVVYFPAFFTAVKSPIYTFLTDPQFVRSAAEAGYDSFKVREYDSSSIGRGQATMTWAVFSPEQICFAIGVPRSVAKLGSDSQCKGSNEVATPAGRRLRP
jgi:hypothetical protein